MVRSHHGPPHSATPDAIPTDRVAPEGIAIRYRRVLVRCRHGFLIGACIVAASFGINYPFSNASWRLLAIDGGYYVVQFTAFGAVLRALR